MEENAGCWYPSVFCWFVTLRIVNALRKNIICQNILRCKIITDSSTLWIRASGLEPFKRDNEQDSFRAILKGEFSLDTPEWKCISMHCKDLIRRLLAVDPVLRLNAIQTTKHRWITMEEITGHILPEIPYRLECFNQRCLERVSWFKPASVIHRSLLEVPIKTE